MAESANKVVLDQPLCGKTLDELIHRLGKDASIESLTMREMRVDDHQLAKLVDAASTSESKMKKLAVPLNLIGNSGVKSLARAQFLNLTSLNLSGNVFSVDEEISDALATNKTVQKLQLCGIQLNSEDGACQRLSKVLSTNTTLTKLNLSACWLGNNDLDCLAQGLMRNSSLTSLDLSGNLITTFATFAKYLATTNSLSALNLSANQIDLEAATQLGSSLQQNQSLKELSLSNCQLCNEGASFIFECLADHPALEAFYVNDNFLGAISVSALSSMLKGKQTIKYLYYSGNRIGIRGLAVLHNVLKDNKSLTNLNLGDNDLYDESCEWLAKIIASNKSLVKLNLAGNRLTSAGIEMLRAEFDKSETLLRVNTRDNLAVFAGLFKERASPQRVVSMNFGSPDSLAQPLKARVYLLGEDRKTYIPADSAYVDVLVYLDGSVAKLKVTKEDKTVAMEFVAINRIVFNRAPPKDGRTYIYWTYMCSTYVAKFRTEADTDLFFTNVSKPKPLVRPAWVKAQRRDSAPRAPVVQHKSSKRSFKELNMKFVKFNEISLNSLIIGEFIANGGQAVVRKGTWQKLTVAIKEMVHFDKKDDIPFRRELDILSTLKHENIVMIIGACTVSDKKYLVLEYANGGTLYDYIHTSALQGMSEFKETMLAIVRGVVYLHKRGIMHRDLKPSNILRQKMSANVTVLKIADFGSAKERKPLSGQINTAYIGTANYTAPERISGEWFCQYNEAVDVFSLGMIMYEILERKVPFKGLATWDILGKIKEGHRPKFEQTPESLRPLIEQCWHQNPFKRPTSMDLLREIENLPSF